jgi:hypothetical protein
VALPVPLLAAVTAIHPVLLLTAVHPHPLVVVTPADCAPPAATTVCVVGVSVKLQVPACVTVSVRPAIVSVPVRGLEDVLAATLNATVPFPDALAPLVTVIQPALLIPVHPHPVDVATVVVYDPPFAGTLSDEDETVKLQAPVPVKLNVFDRALRVVPPGPMAATSAE